MVNEGGGIHVDGEGTVMITRTVQLDPFRNPDWTAEQVEAELRAFLGVEKVIWLPQGPDQGLQAVRHARPCRHGCRVGAARASSSPTRNPTRRIPTYEVCNENLAILRASTDARGRQLEVVEIEAPDSDSRRWRHR